MNDLIIGVGAEEDYTVSLQWYRQRSLEAAIGFETEISNAMGVIADGPGRFPFCDGVH